MSKNPSKLEPICSLKDYLTMADLEAEDYNEPLNILKFRKVCCDEIAKMEFVLVKLQMVNEHLEVFRRCMDVVDRLYEIENKLHIDELTSNTVALSYSHKLRKHSQYYARLRVCIKMYMELNVILVEKVKVMRSTYKEVEDKIEQLTRIRQDDIKMLEKKISRYEHELAKLEKKYPWLNNSDHNLPNISKEVNLLIAARREKQELVQEVSLYQGLQPDIQQANRQLTELKQKYEELNIKLLQ